MTSATTSRTTYPGGTPTSNTFAPTPQSNASFIPAPQSPVPSPMSTTRPPRPLAGRVRKVYRAAADTVANNVGMLLIAASQGFFSLMNVSVKKLNSIDPPVPAFELIWVRMTITWLCCISYMLVMKVPDPFLGPKAVRWLLVLRGFVGFFGLFGVYYSLQYLSLSDATVLTFLAPMCTIVTGAIFLKEVITWKQAAAGLCSLFGVVLIARPQSIFGSASLEDVIPLDESAGDMMAVTPAQRLTAVGVALIGVLGATGAYTTIRAIGKQAHPMHNLVSFSTQCVIVSTIAMIIMKTPVVIPTRLDWVLMLIMIGIFGFCAQILLTMGLQRETAGRGTMAVYVQIVFATTFEQVFFHTTPSVLSVIGTIIIMGSAIYVAVTKENPPNKSGEDISLEEGLLAHQEEDLAEDALTKEDEKIRA
ncbi:EamA-like transporter family-domain-containing protein [Cristinia sonorae]|uniref:EamA-like transporter family-domain-containing protein n=1 Tax=Cristinia sonorae TaxID=1940300 RepID=A0A8K0UXF4_9AGAR|nr:EamA-like transporter family-domain-containing protein [Cristinia sonorae]